MNPPPTIGRIVQYMSYGTPGGEYLPLPRAAIITQVESPGYGHSRVGLAVLNPTGLFFNPSVEHAPDGKPTPGHWNWPPRD